MLQNLPPLDQQEGFSSRFSQPSLSPRTHTRVLLTSVYMLCSCSHTLKVLLLKDFITSLVTASVYWSVAHYRHLRCAWVFLSPKQAFINNRQKESIYNLFSFTFLGSDFRPRGKTKPPLLPPSLTNKKTSTSRSAEDLVCILAGS